MEIRSSASLANIITAADAPSQRAESLKVGAILDVIVQVRLEDNRFQLRQLPDGELLTGVGHTELSVGQRLQVQVIRLGSLPELRILTEDPPSQEIVPKALRELLPKQIDMKEFSAMLSRLSHSGSPNLTDPVRMAVERLNAAMPQAEELMTPEGLQKAIRNSGLFLEASLAAVLTDGATLPENDLKMRLLSLLAVLHKEMSGKPAAGQKNLKQLTPYSAPQAVSSPPAKQVREESAQQPMPAPESTPRKPENLLPKISDEPFPSSSGDKGAAALGFTRGLPVVPNALLMPEARKPVIEQVLPDAESRANPADFLKSEDEWPAAAPKPQTPESIPLPPRNPSALPLADKAENSLGTLELLDMEKLAQKAEGALAKITVNQMASQTHSDGAVSLQLTLPFVYENHQDNVNLKFISDGASGNEGPVKSSWTATIQLHPPGMSIFNARIIWNGTQIDACLWSDQEETGNRIGDASETLRAKLEQAGLVVGALIVLDRPPVPSAEAVAPPLLDLRA